MKFYEDISIFYGQYWFPKVFMKFFDDSSIFLWTVKWFPKVFYEIL